MKHLIFLSGIVALFATGVQCSNKPSGSEKAAAFRTRGDSITAKAQQLLISRLLTQIENSGITGAVQYCSIQALPLLNSLQTKDGITIQRISEKFRNPANQPVTADLPVLQHYANSMSKRDTVVRTKKHYIYYKPIYVAMNTCLKCHGSSFTIDPPALAVLKARYPNDKATGYVLNDFRGAWKLQVPKAAF